MAKSVTKNPKRKKPDTDTEEKIKAAARRVFQLKGYAAAGIRDIANEAGINLALVNYYFRSKEKLFDLIMMESMSEFVGVVGSIVNDEQTTITEKVKLLTARYTELLLANPDLPTFILNEIRLHPDKFIQRTRIDKAMTHAFFVKQLKERSDSDTEGFNLFMSLIGMIVYPYVAAPLFKQMSSLTEKDYRQLMQQREELIPKWFEAMLNT